jgi:hypothetical protein
VPSPSSGGIYPTTLVSCLLGDHPVLMKDGPLSLRSVRHFAITLTSPAVKTLPGAIGGSRSVTLP